MKSFIVSKIKESVAILTFVHSYIFKVKGKKCNAINYKGAFLKRTRIEIKGKNNSVNILPESRLTNCLIHISGDNCIINIGKACVLTNQELWIEDNLGKIEIGYGTTMEGGHIAATEGQSISIGEDCMFSYRIEIRNGDSHAIFDLDSKFRINNAKDVTIGNHVWLGADSKVLKGSILENNVVIAAGSIVTSLCESNSIYGGVPARKIKSSIFWKRER